jgi:hypothetical protein
MKLKQNRKKSSENCWRKIARKTVIKTGVQSDFNYLVWANWKCTEKTL